MKPISKKKKRILRHIGRYSLTIRSVLDRKFFGGTDGGCHNTIQALLSSELVSQHSLGSHSYYQLTASGAKTANLPLIAAKDNSQNLREHLAVLWFCNMGKHERELLYRDQLREYFPKTRLQSRHCIEPAVFNRPICVYRMRLVGPNVSDSSVLKSLQQYVEKALDDEGEIRPGLLQKHYGFAVLGHGAHRLKKLRREARRRKIFESLEGRSHFRIPFQFELVPSPETLGETLRELRKNS